MAESQQNMEPALENTTSSQEGDIPDEVMIDPSRDAGEQGCPVADTSTAPQQQNESSDSSASMLQNKEEPVGSDSDNVKETRREQQEGVMDASSVEETSPTTEPASVPHDTTSNINSQAEKEPPAADSAATRWKKARVAVTGGVVTAVGLVMIPAPLPVGAIITAYGVSILAQEFEGAQVALDNGKKTLETGFEKLADTLHKEDEQGEETSSEEKDAGNASRAQQIELEEESSCSPTAVEENGTTGLASENDTTKQATPNVAQKGAPAPNDQELEDILLNEKQSFLEGAERVWELHTRNMRKVTSRFITSKLLPAIRDVNIDAESAEKTKVAPSALVANTTTKGMETITASDDTASMNVPLSTTSIASSSESSSSDESSNESDNDFVEVVFPEQVAARTKDTIP